MIQVLTRSLVALCLSVPALGADAPLFGRTNDIYAFQNQPIFVPTEDVIDRVIKENQQLLDRGTAQTNGRVSAKAVRTASDVGAYLSRSPSASDENLMFIDIDETLAHTSNLGLIQRALTIKDELKIRQRDALLAQAGFWAPAAFSVVMNTYCALPNFASLKTEFFFFSGAVISEDNREFVNALPNDKRAVYFVTSRTDSEAQFTKSQLEANGVRMLNHGKFAALTGLQSGKHIDGITYATEDLAKFGEHGIGIETLEAYLKANKDRAIEKLTVTIIENSLVVFGQLVSAANLYLTKALEAKYNVSITYEFYLTVEEAWMSPAGDKNWRTLKSIGVDDPEALALSALEKYLTK